MTIKALEELGGPAFPMKTESGITKTQWYGMSLRDYFAAKAMQGVLAYRGMTTEWEVVSLFAYHIADAMLAAKRQTEEE